MSQGVVELGAAVGGLACCVATSPPNPGGEWTPTIQADIFVHNGNDYDIVVRVRPIRGEVDFDCEAVAEDPGRLLSSALFDDATSWTLAPDSNMTLIADTDESLTWEFSREQRECYAYIVDSDNVPPAVVFWMDGEYRTRSVDGEGFDPSLEGYIDIRHDEDGRGAYDVGGEFLYQVPERGVEPEGQCAPADERQRVAWSGQVPTGTWVLGPVSIAPDGCVQMDLRTGFEAMEDLDGRSWTLCVPRDAFGFAQGDQVSILPEHTGRTLSGETSGLQIQRVDPVTGVAVEGGDALVVSSGAGIADMFGATATFTELVDCGAATEAACGTVSRAGRLTLSGGEVSTLELGGTNTRAEVPSDDGSTITFHLVHAQRRMALDPECADGPDSLGTDIDLVAVRRAPAQ